MSSNSIIWTPMYPMYPMRCFVAPVTLDIGRVGYWGELAVGRIDSKSSK